MEAEAEKMLESVAKDEKASKQVRAEAATKLIRHQAGKQGMEEVSKKGNQRDHNTFHNTNTDTDNRSPQSWCLTITNAPLESSQLREKTYSPRLEAGANITQPSCGKFHKKET